MKIDFLWHVQYVLNILKAPMADLKKCDSDRMKWIGLDFLWKIAPQLWSNVQGHMMQLNCHMGDGTTTVTLLGHNRDTKVPN